jgi:hypothetical protein
MGDHLTQARSLEDDGVPFSQAMHAHCGDDGLGLGDVLSRNGFDAPAVAEWDGERRRGKVRGG